MKKLTFVLIIVLTSISIRNLNAQLPTTVDSGQAALCCWDEQKNSCSSLDTKSKTLDEMIRVLESLLKDSTLSPEYLNAIIEKLKKLKANTQLEKTIQCPPAKIVPVPLAKSITGIPPQDPMDNPPPRQPDPTKK